MLQRLFAAGAVGLSLAFCSTTLATEDGLNAKIHWKEGVSIRPSALLTYGRRLLDSVGLPSVGARGTKGAPLESESLALSEEPLAESSALTGFDVCSKAVVVAHDTFGVLTSWTNSVCNSAECLNFHSACAANDTVEECMDDLFVRLGSTYCTVRHSASGCFLADNDFVSAESFEGNGTATNSFECQELCQKVQLDGGNCQGFSFTEATGICLLHQRVTDTVEAVGTVVGPGYCDGFEDSNFSCSRNVTLLGGGSLAMSDVRMCALECEVQRVEGPCAHLEKSPDFADCLTAQLLIGDYDREGCFFGDPTQSVDFDAEWFDLSGVTFSSFSSDVMKVVASASFNECLSFCQVGVHAAACTGVTFRESPVKTCFLYSSPRPENPLISRLGSTSAQKFTTDPVTTSSTTTSTSTATSTFTSTSTATTTTATETTTITSTVVEDVTTVPA